jgi:hypothetical protein
MMAPPCWFEVNYTLVRDLMFIRFLKIFSDSSGIRAETGN